MEVPVELVDLADEDDDESEAVDEGRRPPSRPPPSVEVEAAVWIEFELLVELGVVLEDGESAEVDGEVGWVGGVVAAGGGACRLAKR